MRRTEELVEAIVLGSTTGNCCAALFAAALRRLRAALELPLPGSDREILLAGVESLVTVSATPSRFMHPLFLCRGLENRESKKQGSGGPQSRARSEHKFH